MKRKNGKGTRFACISVRTRLQCFPPVLTIALPFFCQMGRVELEHNRRPPNARPPPPQCPAYLPFTVKFLFLYFAGQCAMREYLPLFMGGGR